MKTPRYFFKNDGLNDVNEVKPWHPAVYVIRASQMPAITIGAAITVFATIFNIYPLFLF